VQIVAVLGEVFGVCGIEGQTVAAGLQLGNAIVALPVFVAGRVVWIESKVIGTLKATLGHSCNSDRI